MNDQISRSRAYVVLIEAADLLLAGKLDGAEKALLEQVHRVYKGKLRALVGSQPSTVTAQILAVSTTSMRPRGNSGGIDSRLAPRPLLLIVFDARRKYFLQQTAELVKSADFGPPQSPDGNQSSRRSRMTNDRCPCHLLGEAKIGTTLVLNR